MTDWKPEPGGWAMVRVLHGDVGFGWALILTPGGNATFPQNALHPLPATLTPEDEAVLSRAEIARRLHCTAGHSELDCAKARRNLWDAMDARAARSAPVPADSAWQVKIGDRVRRKRDGALGTVVDPVPQWGCIRVQFDKHGQWDVFPDHIEPAPAEPAPKPAEWVPKVGDRVRVLEGILCGLEGVASRRVEGDECGWDVEFGEGCGRARFSTRELEPVPVSPALPALERAVVEAARYQRRVLNECGSTIAYDEATDATEAAVANLEAALAPPPAVDPVGELREAADSARLLLAEAERGIPLGQSRAGMVADRLSAAIAALPTKD